MGAYLHGIASPSVITNAVNSVGHKRYEIISEDDLRKAMERALTFIVEPQTERQPTPIGQPRRSKK